MGILSSINKERKRGFSSANRARKKAKKQTMEATGLIQPELDPLELPGEQPVAPVPDDEASKIANMLKYRRRYAKAGRAGTILTAGTKLG